MATTIKVLLAEDDTNLGSLLKDYLEAKSYDTELCVNGEEAFLAFKKSSYDICIFDVMMPLKDGFTLAKEIRKIDKKTPIIFLTAKAMKQDTLEGFNVGADDYITKPFSMEELIVRMKAILRRTYQEKDKDHQPGKISIGKFVLEYNLQKLTIQDFQQKLTSKETDLLKLLCENVNDVVDRTVALNRIWEDDSYFNARSMDVYITKLRKYLKEDDSVELINVHGKGFKLVTK